MTDDDEVRAGLIPYDSHFLHLEWGRIGNAQENCRATWRWNR